MNKYKFYFVDSFTLTNKQLYPIIYLLFTNSFKSNLSTDATVKYTLIALCSILNENKDTFEKLKKDLFGEFNEILIENIKQSLLIVFEFYKKTNEDITYLDILKDTRGFIAVTTVVYELIKQNNFNFKQFNTRYSNIDSTSKEIINIKNIVNKISINK